MEVVALIPVEAGEAKEAGKDEDQQQRHHSQRFGSRERPARRRLGCYLFCGSRLALLQVNCHIDSRRSPLYVRHPMLYTPVLTGA